MLFVTDEATLQQALAIVIGADLLAYDIETSGLDMRADVIVGFGCSTAGVGFYVPLLDNNLAPLPGAQAFAAQIWAALVNKPLLTFNGAFDIAFTLCQTGINLLPNLHTDVMLLKHTCDENFPFGLKEIATKLWGHDVTKEKEEMQASIKANGGSAKQFYKASTQTLGTYCIQDCYLTWRVYAHYSTELRKQGLHAFFYQDEVMPLYREVTIPMELTGVRLDMPKLHTTKAALDTELASLEARIQALIAPHLEIFTSWFLNKDYPLTTFKSGKPSAWCRKFATQADAWRADNPTNYMFNLQSKHHLKKLFFDTLSCEPLSRTPTGQPQVDEDFLDSVASQFDWVPLLIQYNKLNKLRSTYVTRFIEESRHGRFYARYMQHRTVSGRYGGDLQQLPRPIPEGDIVAQFTNIVREFVVPDSGCVLMSADYEQLEPTIFAHASSDANLQAIFNSGADFYSTVAIRTEGIKASADKSSPDYLGKKDKAARQKAKAYALGIAYGMTGYKLQYELGIPVELADELVRKYLAAFPGLAAFIHKAHDQARSLGWVQQELDRKRHMPEAARIWKQYGSRIQDSLGLWKDYNSSPENYAAVKDKYREYKNYMNNAVNFQVQSLAASIVNRAAICVAKRLQEEGLCARICMQVHDELVLNVPLAEVDAVSKLVKHTMETIVKLSVPLRTEPQCGNNFRECK